MMNYINYIIVGFVFVLMTGLFIIYLRANMLRNKEFTLPAPNFDGKISVEKAIKTRRSIRSYKQEPLTLSHVSQLMWAAQGVTGDHGFRAAPSAGALYPLEIYLVAGNVTDLKTGVYKYSNKNHALVSVADGDKRVELSDAALSQEWVREAPASIVVCGIYERTSKKYGERATKYVHMEVGCVAQNVYLQATALGLGTTFVGAIDEENVVKVLGVSKSEHPLVVLPVGVVG